MQKSVLLILFLAMLIIAVVFVIEWRSGQQYNEKLRLTAIDMNYTCEGCAAELKVLSVSDKKFDFIIQDKIRPVQVNNDAVRLCEFIKRASESSVFNETDTGLIFTLVGKLHRYKTLWNPDACSNAISFVVDSIQYGNNRWYVF